MKKLKILSLVLVVALFLCTLAGCSGISVSSLYNTKKVNQNADKIKLLNSSEKLSYENECVDSFGDVLVFKSNSATQDTYTFYNVSNKKVVHTETQNLNSITKVDFVYNSYGDFVFYVYSNFENLDGETQYKISVRSSDGLLIKECVSDDQNEVLKEIPTYNIDLLKIGDDFFRMNRKGVYKLVASIPSSERIPQFFAKNGDYYYDYTENDFSVFNDQLDLIYYYQCPENLELESLNILNNGKVLIQYTREVLDNDKDYDFINKSTPYVIVSKIIDVKKDKIKELDLDYLAELVSRDTLYAEQYVNFEIYDKSIDNFGCVYEVKNDVIDENPKVVSFNNKCKIKDRFDEMFKGQTYGLAGLPKTIGAADRYAIINVYGQKFLLDGKGNKIGDITNASYLNGKYVIIDDVIYDMNLVEVNSCEDYEIVDAFDSLQASIIFRKTVGLTNKYFLFTNGEFKQITDSSESTIVWAYQNHIAIKNNQTGKISVFNENFEQLLTTDADIKLSLFSYEYGIVLSGYNATTTKYETYLISSVAKR